VIRFPLAAWLVLASCGLAAANDSVGHLSAGGIVLGRTDDIEMRAEDLYVSTKEIRVRYRFFNKADRDITTLVAFPMPDVAAPSDTNNVVIPIDNSENFLGFKTQTDGKPVTIQLEQRAVALGIDRTELLKSLKVPLSNFMDATKAALAALPADKQAELVRLGIARVEEYDEGKGMRKHTLPDWSLRTTYYWMQTFPAQKEILVEHQYQPSVGGSVSTSVATTPEAAVENRRRYCVDREIENAVTRKKADLKRGPNGRELSERRFEYILTTGAHWAGPIKDFRLVIDKLDPGHIISACGKFKRISPTQFELRQTDYYPDRNLEVLVLEPLQ